MASVAFEGLLPVHRWCLLAVSSHSEEARELLALWDPFNKDTDPILEGSSLTPNHLPLAFLSNTITLGVGISTYSKHSDHSKRSGNFFCRRVFLN